ncbi:TadE/TadG family type IV pilus assembly protein [Methylobacterium sp. J-076]|uniref:TadE/TadG family type IV pilus assembly protein n=1 Tax=Methylobacterium sp. J-076 TaxID=2836655 RepID=UPI001FBA57F9|nr:TadE/TadG family type IV pilus assembly protein [Methylobacterium sp. J-076]MCJ2013436.1 pilus assembly protein [Methylobacterium sp. J-076]
MRPPASLTRFGRDRRGIAVVEFSLIFPILLALSAGIFEYSSFVRQSRQLTDTANSIAEILAAGSDNTVNYTDLHYAYDSAMLTFPKVLSDSTRRGIAWSRDITISLAGVSFTASVNGCTANCTYVANINWTGAAAERACSTHPNSASNTSAPSAGTLPASLFTPVASPQGGNGPPLYVVVADVTYTWTPSVFTGLLGVVVMKRSSYINPRYVSALKYQAVSGDDAFGKACPGYS